METPGAGVDGLVAAGVEVAEGVVFGVEALVEVDEPVELEPSPGTVEVSLEALF